MSARTEAMQAFIDALQSGDAAAALDAFDTLDAAKAMPDDEEAEGPASDKPAALVLDIGASKKGK